VGVPHGDEHLVNGATGERAVSSGGSHASSFGVAMMVVGTTKKTSVPDMHQRLPPDISFRHGK
jgi:hypothetical protein